MFMSLTSVFIGTKSWKQPKWSTAGEWINKLWYMHRIEYDSVTKSSKLPKHTTGVVKETSFKRLSLFDFMAHKLKLFNAAKIIANTEAHCRIQSFHVHFLFDLIRSFSPFNYLLSGG